MASSLSLDTETEERPWGGGRVKIIEMSDTVFCRLHQVHNKVNRLRKNNKLHSVNLDFVIGYLIDITTPIIDTFDPKWRKKPHDQKDT